MINLKYRKAISLILSVSLLASTPMLAVDAASQPARPLVKNSFVTILTALMSKVKDGFVDLKNGVYNFFVKEKTEKQSFVKSLFKKPATKKKIRIKNATFAATISIFLCLLYQLLKKSFKGKPGDDDDDKGDQAVSVQDAAEEVEELVDGISEAKEEVKEKSNYIAKVRNFFTKIKKIIKEFFSRKKTEVQEVDPQEEELKDLEKGVVESDPETDETDEPVVVVEEVGIEEETEPTDEVEAQPKKSFSSRIGEWWSSFSKSKENKENVEKVESETDEYADVVEEEGEVEEDTDATATPAEEPQEATEEDEDAPIKKSKPIPAICKLWSKTKKLVKYIFLLEFLRKKAQKDLSATASETTDREEALRQAPVYAKASTGRQDDREERDGEEESKVSADPAQDDLSATASATADREEREGEAFAEPDAGYSSESGEEEEEEEEEEGEEFEETPPLVEVENVSPAPATKEVTKVVEEHISSPEASAEEKGSEDEAPKSPSPRFVRSADTLKGLGLVKKLRKNFEETTPKAAADEPVAMERRPVSVADNADDAEGDKVLETN